MVAPGSWWILLIFVNLDRTFSRETNMLGSRKISPEESRDAPVMEAAQVLEDYRICCLSRALSLTMRREVLTGKAKFATTDDGKEVLQVAMAKAFRPGDFRAGYYRGHTLMLALGLATPQQLLAQLYADAERDTSSYGRQMPNHHATPLVDLDGNWLEHTATYNISSDISPTAGQMARAFGLAYASRKFRERPELGEGGLSRRGKEVVFCNIGDGSTSEGGFWEVMNAAGVEQIPLAVSVWDDGYGISVPTRMQTVKGSISEALAGLERSDQAEGLAIYRVDGWNYPALCQAYLQGIDACRRFHIPTLFHIQELTQPQGHSTSGSHERYKSSERLAWEEEYDCNRQFRLWLLDQGYATEAELDTIERDAAAEIKKARKEAWTAFRLPIRADRRLLHQLYEQLMEASVRPKLVRQAIDKLDSLHTPCRSDLMASARQVLFQLKGEKNEAMDELRAWLRNLETDLQAVYHTHLHSEDEGGALRVPEVPARIPEDAPALNGYEIINRFFRKLFEQRPDVFAFGEDLGMIGGVNQGFAGLQQRFGKERIFDTGIREWTIVGQALGMAMRGLRPIAEIQYLDYLLYGLSPLVDDVATLRYRTAGRQIAPLIIRTRGHRLEGIWHSGSPMGMIISALRGMYVLVPRDFTRAAGMYNTLLQGNDPALLVECLNGYRHKEPLPENLGEYTIPLGKPEVLRAGSDLTLVTYGACVRIARQAAERLHGVYGISVELIDVQTLLPFDIEHAICASLRKTNRLLVLDEDVPGGASAFILGEILEKQGGYRYLDSPPRTLTAQPHRPPYGSDGDYLSKPNVEDVCEAVYDLIYESDPNGFPGP